MLDDSCLIGDLVQIDFLDHRETSADPHEVFAFTVVGRVRQITEWSISVDCWYYTDPDEDIRAQHASNVTGYCIVKSAIQRIRLIGYLEEDDPAPLRLVE